MSIELELKNTNLIVYTNTLGRISLPLAWVRDHCFCEECHHAETKQRLASSFTTKSINVKTISVDENNVMIEWDDHTSTYPISLFTTLRKDPENLDIEHFLWDRDTISPYTPSVSYHELINDDSGIEMLIGQVERYGFCFVTDTPPTKEGTIEVSERIAYIRQTIFGGYYEMEANLEHKDTAYTPLAIGPHTDGTYSNDAPSYQVLHCLAEDCIGGENVLVDGFKIAQIMRTKYNEEYLTLTQVPVPGQYIDMARGIHLMARRPIFRLNDDNEVIQISYNNHDRAPFYLEQPQQMEKFYSALEIFAELLADPQYHYRRKLQPGLALFFDNWRVLHARDAYSGYRKLAGVYFNKEDVESRLRTLRNKREENNLSTVSDS